MSYKIKLATMKRYFSLVVLFALAVLTLGSCVKGAEEELVGEQIGPRTVSFNVSMADQTRTGLAFKFVPYWTETDVENVHLYEMYQGTAIEGHDVKMDIEEDRHNEVAHFQADFTEEMVIIINPPSSTSSVLTRAGETSEYTYGGIFAKKVDDTFVVPATQYPDKDLLIDPDADFLVGSSKQGFSKSQTNKDVDLFFVRPVAASRLAIMNIEGTVIRTVTITSTDKLTGVAKFADVNFETGEVAFDAASGETTLTLDYGDGVSIPAESTFYAYFISLAGAKSITSIEVTTDTYVYTKTFEGGKTLTFKTNDFKNIAVDMSKVTPTPADPDQSKTQNLSFHKNSGTITTDSFVLGSGDYVTPTLQGAAEGATVEWTVECNPEGVATVAKVEGVWTVTPVKAGTAIITATASAVDGWKETSLSYTLTVTDAETQTLAFDPASLEVTLGAQFEEPTLSGAKTAVTYASSDKTVANVDASTGELTIKAAGSSTITATAAAGKGSDEKYYAEAEASYVLTVNEPAPATSTTYTLVTKEEDVVDGNYLIVAPSDDMIFDGTGTYQGGYTVIADAEAITRDAEKDQITITGATTAYDFAFAKSGNGFTITGAKGMIVAAANDGATTSTETYITFKETGGSVFLQRGKLTTDDKALLFSTTRGTSSEEYIYYNSNGFFKIGGSGSTRGIHLYAANRAAQTLAYSATEVSYDMASGDFVAPTLSGDYHTTVTYSSNKESVATIDASGAVTIKGKGKTIITATAPASAEYFSATASYELNVTNSASQDLVYNKVTSVDDLEADGKYLLVYESASAAFKPILNGSIFTKSTANVLGVEIVNNTISSSELSDCEITFEEGKYLWIESAGKYLYPGASGDSALGAEDKNTSHTVSVSITNGIANISRTSDASYHLYWSTNSKYFSGVNNTGSSYADNLCLYKLDDGRQTPTMSFSPATAEFDLATPSSFTKPSLTYTGDATEFTYTSSDTSIAEVSNDGTITPHKKGTVTITAKAARTEAYKAASASYTLTVVNSNVQPVTYYKASMLDAGYDYVIVSANKALGNNGNGNVVAAKDVQVQNNTISLEDADDLLWTVANADASLSDNGKFTLKNGAQYLYRNGGAATSTLIASTEPATPKYGVWNYDGTYFYNISTSSGTSLYYAYYNSGWVITTTKTAADIYTARPAREVSFSASSAEFDIANPSTFVKPTLNGASGATVTYSSSNETYATVANDGTITALKKTSTPITITATVAGSDQYQGASVSYSLTVINSNEKPSVYNKVTSADDLEIGAKYLIVYESGNKVFYPYIDSKGVFAKATDNAIGDVTITEQTITSADLDNCQMTLEEGYYLYVDAEEKYIYPASSSNTALNPETTKNHALTITFNNGVASIKNGNYNFYYSSNSSWFSTTSTATSVNTALYKLDDGKPKAQTISFSEDKVSVNIYGKVPPVDLGADAPTLTGAKTTVTYDSSDQTVATVAADGSVSILKAGITTISVQAQAGKVGDKEYLASNTASYTLTVTNVAPPTYTLISSVDDLVSGGSYLIVSAYSKSDDASYDHKKLFKGTTDGAAEDVTPVSGVITGDYSSYEFVISKKDNSENEYYLKIGNSYLTSSSNASTPFIVLSSSAASLKLTTEKTTDAPYREFAFAYKKSDSKPNETLYYSNDSSDNCFKVGNSGYKYGVHLYKKN